ncbi:glycosyltransferase family 32 protein [Conidiobolus coronatus NRRL 28638]|uniref:Glycosyltransferase family 32 protein n=1 Tax=Conidiobolus coronatus (strain ATCC 28846 / CBS 209.66 / NRRL 28638) TaxID=796925 RepID=A0A137NXU2_CONC2|nr:glycosyltransferase family 32 protein [Conidiobolus coronatus NRRL 28638]|eukprot:KXN67683.1 glycosyltransferase family 32 protein [Conidiobolus coronatus NRRL 28638]
MQKLSKNLTLIIPIVIIFIITISFSINLYKLSNEEDKYSIHLKSPVNINNISDGNINQLTKKIWQTAQSERPQFINKFMNTWHNVSGWEYNFISNNEAIDYLKLKFPELNFTRIAKEQEILAYDLFRYSKIYYEGGLYADSNVEKADEFETSMNRLSECSVIVGIEADFRHNSSRKAEMARDLQLCQWSLYAAPKHPMLKYVTHRITQRLRYRLMRSDSISSEEVMELTGPGIWTDAVKEYLKLVVGVDIEKQMKCGRSYKYKDICMLNSNGFARTAPHSCEYEVKEDNFVLSYHYFWSSWKDSNKGKNLKRPKQLRIA